MNAAAKRKRVEWITACIVILLFVNGCRPEPAQTPIPESGPTATRTSIPQEIHFPTPSASAAIVETQTPPPMVVLTQPTQQTPLPQITTTAGISKPALVQIDAPGPGSKVRDYIWVRANVYPGDGGNIHLLMTGEDGRTITARDLTYSNWAGGWLSIAEVLYFTPAAASEKALLSVYTLDWSGRITAWASVEMLLLQVGPEEIEQHGFQKDPFVVNKPQAGSVITGGSLHLEGYAHLTQPGTTTYQLIDQSGSVIAEQEVSLPTVLPSQGYASFEADLAYQVQKRTPVRLIIKQASSEFQGQTLAVSSLILFLDP